MKVENPLKSQNFKAIPYVNNLPDQRRMKDIIDKYHLLTDKPDQQLFLKFSNPIVRDAFLLLLLGTDIPGIGLDANKQFNQLSTVNIKQFHNKFKEHYKRNLNKFADLRGSSQIQNQIDRVKKSRVWEGEQLPQPATLLKQPTPYMFEVSNGDYWIVGIFFEVDKSKLPKPEQGSQPKDREGNKSRQERSQDDEIQEESGRPVPFGVEAALLALMVVMALVILFSLVYRPGEGDDGRSFYGFLSWTDLILTIDNP